METNTSDAARLLAAKRTIQTTRCAVCGVPITGIKKRRFCSHACNLKAWRAKRAPMKKPPDPH